jgi:predicted RecA/RadA family phage recombinase
MTVTAPSGGVVSGQMDLIHDTVGVYMTDADADEQVAFLTQADKILLPKAAVSPTAFSAGDKVYFDHADEELNESSSGNTLCGRAIEAAAAADTEVLVAFNGLAAA